MTDVAVAGWAQNLAPELVRLLPRQLLDAFVQFPDVVMAFVSMGLAAILVSAFWIIRGAFQASSSAQVALKAQGLRRQKDHRASVLIGHIEGADRRVREQIKRAIEEGFGLFAFQAEAQVNLFPIRLPVLPPAAHAEKLRRIALEAHDVLDRTAGDVIIWGKRNWLGKLDLRVTAAPGYGRMPEVMAIQTVWRGRPDPAVEKAIAYVCARRARPVLNRPQDYKPERLQPIVEALDQLVQDPPNEISESAMLEILGDFASGALSLGERGGNIRWLQKAFEARRAYLDHIDQTADPGAWGAAQQEIGRALAALGEREGARDKLEEAVSRLKIAMDALRATDSLQHAEVAMRALHRAEQTLVQRKRVGLRWPV
ncbi:MAG: hypothetical protein GC189_04035 [Alphaproteobacteria bacterium]|nr:hypothetical protein [Alphaproteobacteria bacterium]